MRIDNRHFYSDSNPGWTVGSVTLKTPAEQYNRFEALMREHEAEIETYAKDFGGPEHTKSWRKWAALYEQLLKQAGVTST